VSFSFCGFFSTKNHIVFVFPISVFCFCFCVVSISVCSISHWQATLGKNHCNPAFSTGFWQISAHRKIHLQYAHRLGSIPHRQASGIGKPVVEARCVGIFYWGTNSTPAGLPQSWGSTCL
jgi:hypothetical protein